MFIEYPKMLYRNGESRVVTDAEGQAAAEDEGFGEGVEFAPQADAEGQAVKRGRKPKGE